MGFVGCMFLTAQECPETNKRLREDLYKKTMSADGISGRKPYGITTRMFELVGWKRIELNRMMRFQGVTGANFMSILRRSFVWTPKARFLDADYLESHFADAAQDGISRRTHDFGLSSNLAQLRVPCSLCNMASNCDIAGYSVRP